MFIKNGDFDQFIENLSAYRGKNFSSFIRHFSNDDIKSCLIQHLNRNIEGEDIDFIGLRTIDIEPHSRKQKLFSRIIYALEATHLPVIVDDIVSDIVDDFLDNRGYVKLSYKKNSYDDVYRVARYKLY
jgi:hypothetical protein